MSIVNPSQEESLDKATLPSLQEPENRARQDLGQDHAQDHAKKAELLDALYPPLPQVRPRFPLPLTYREIGRGYHPGRGLGLSICFHLFLLLLLLASRSVFLDSPRVVVELPSHPDQLAKVLYLPVLGGGSEGGGREGGGSGQTAKASSGLRARSRRGFAYPGPQPMVSSPPRATLGMQTILQPTLKNPPLLKQLLNLPNIVRPAAAPIPELAQKALVVNPGTVALRPTPAQPIAAPKMTLPAAAASAIPALTASAHTLPESPVVQQKLPRPEVSDVPTGPRNQDGLLVMNAIPPPPDLTAKIPRAEARSLFAVAPGEATVIADPAAGTKTGEASSSATGSGSRADIAKGDALAELAGGGDAASHASSGSGSGSGGRYGSGHGTGLNASGNGRGTGRGTGSESGVGTGSGTSRASGTGAGTASGTGGFAGIAIQGGRYGNGNTGSMLTNSKPGYPNSYNMNIVSTGSSGGGLPDFGVFQNEKVYTVYLDMRANDEDPAPSWTLQYAVLQPAAGDPGGSAERIQGTPTPPYATLKEVPEFTPELMRKCGRQLIVASAIIDASGKVEQVSVRKSPESQLVGPLVEALEHWIFEPALIDGRPVALKILLGIRLAASR